MGKIRIFTGFLYLFSDGVFLVLHAGEEGLQPFPDRALVWLHTSTKRTGCPQSCSRFSG